MNSVWIIVGIAILFGLALIVGCVWIVWDTFKQNKKKSNRVEKRDKIFIGIWFLFSFGVMFFIEFNSIKIWAIIMVLILYFWVKIISPNQKKK